MIRRILAAALLLLALAAPAATRAGEVPTLGARLDTAGTWVAVISRANIASHVELSSEGDVHLTETAFDMQPGERHQVAYSGSGLGWVSARMTPIGEGQGALEVRAWVRYVAPPPPADSLPAWAFLLALAAILTIAWRVHHRATR